MANKLLAWEGLFVLLCSAVLWTRANSSVLPRKRLGPTMVIYLQAVCTSITVCVGVFFFPLEDILFLGISLACDL